MKELEPGERVASLIEVLEKLAGGEFGIRLPISQKRDAVDAISFGINLLADEIQYRVKRDQDQMTALEETSKQLSATLTELRETQGQLIHSAKLAALGEVCAGLAHEINNPLAVIMGVAHAVDAKIRADRAMDPSYLATQCEAMIRNIDRISKVVQHIQIFSRQVESRIGSANVNDVIGSSLTLFREQFKINQIELVHCESERPLFIVTDAFQLEQVLINLLSNAKDAILSKRSARASLNGVIQIQAQRDGEEIVIEVQDNGIGVDESIREKIFQPFFTTKGAQKGSGLGLSVCHGIVKSLGGSISFESIIGNGTRFRIQLPAISSRDT